MSLSPGDTFQNLSVHRNGSTTAIAKPPPSKESLPENLVWNYLLEQLETPTLNELYQRLWLVGKPSGIDIDPLHHQRVKHLQIVPTEDANLHLVWNRTTIYLKPLPRCLLHPVTSSLISSSGTKSQAKPAALGFLRSYSRLIRTELDLSIAQLYHLVPPELDYATWIAFIRPYFNIQDEEVAKRYHYGQLRISRLNWLLRMTGSETARTRWFYHLPYFSFASYIEKMLAPFVIVFASVAVMLSAMQVIVSIDLDEVASPAARGSTTAHWVFWVFSILLLLGTCLVWVLTTTIPCVVLLWQLQWGYRHRGRLHTKSSLDEQRLPVPLIVELGHHAVEALKARLTMHDSSP
ncbi:Endoplasmic reticulum membrane protein 65 [Elsinoe australis]|uniref:Endoplasmic reticulum membrane protein 65 n=1 Tax=Elsinoe australis TaxID=40998 RepID=A0A2P8AE83_9PEZI|nr:Endoplasmic reticulum membrane protein 65 [Elsinoe australis]